MRASTEGRVVSVLNGSLLIGACTDDADDNDWSSEEIDWPPSSAAAQGTGTTRESSTSSSSRMMALRDLSDPSSSAGLLQEKPSGVLRGPRRTATRSASASQRQSQRHQQQQQQQRRQQEQQQQQQEQRKAVESHQGLVLELNKKNYEMFFLFSTLAHVVFSLSSASYSYHCFQQVDAYLRNTSNFLNYKALIDDLEAGNSTRFDVSQPQASQSASEPGEATPLPPFAHAALAARRAAPMDAW